MRVLLLVLTFLYMETYAQSEEDRVKQVISSLFDGMKRSDSNLIRSAFAPDAVLQTVAKSKEGQTVIHAANIADFITSITKPHKETYDERITFDMIRIDSDLASVWTPYKFYLDDKFLHCGVNSFQLVRLDKEWKIQYIIDTRRSDNCF
jgi:hypothetical protein